MVTNKYAKMLHRNENYKIIQVLVYAILEWILIFLLLVNSLLSFLISKFAFYFCLKPPCTFCSCLNKNRNSYKDLICEQHVYEISQLGRYPTQENLTLEAKKEEKSEEIEFYTDNVIEPKIYDQTNDEVQKKNTNEVFEKMEIGELVSSIISAMQDLVGVATEEAQSQVNEMEGGNEFQEGEENDCRSSDGELEFEFFKGMVPSSPRGQLNQSCEERDEIGTLNGLDTSVFNNVDQDSDKEEEPKVPHKLLPFKNGAFDSIKYCNETSRNGKEFEDDAMIIEKLKKELKAEREALNTLYMELEEERSASAIATSQTMSMMTRLQQEKAAVQMEAQQYQRMMEEQSEYDQEALQLLNDLMVKKEKEKQELEKELESYRKRVLDYEDQEKIPLTPENYKYGQPSAGSCCILGSENGLTSNDNNNNCEDRELDFEEMGIDSTKNMSLIDESLGEFEEERLSILEELKVLEMKLVTLANDDEETYYPKYEDKFENAMIVNVKPKKLLPFYDQNEKMDEEEIESSSTNKIKCLDYKFKMVNKRVRIEEEMGHVYERLQGLETDRDFLKHCISSLNEGDKGIDILKEILEHLRDLRTVEDRARSIYDSPLS